MLRAWSRPSPIVLLILALGATIDLATTRGNLSVPMTPAGAQAELQQLPAAPIARPAIKFIMSAAGFCRSSGGCTALGLARPPIGCTRIGMHSNITILASGARRDRLVPVVCARRRTVYARAVGRASPPATPSAGSGGPSISNRCSLARAICCSAKSIMSCSLFVERVEVLARGLVLWSRAVPQAFCSSFFACRRRFMSISR